MGHPLLRTAAVIGAFALSGCSGVTKASSDSTAGGTGGAGEGGSTQQECAAGEAPLTDGSCGPAGVPADACGDGFASDDHGGCTAVLPDGGCPAGTMAVPGETSCREVASCGRGAWGDIRTDAATQFVDASYTGGTSDGTQLHPWSTIQEAVVAASAGATVAVAAGSYAGTILVASKPVVIWGRCPELVGIVGPEDVGAVAIHDGANGTMLRSIAISGEGVGVQVRGTEDVVLDRVWIHGAPHGGAIIEEGDGPASAAIEGSLLEANEGIGVLVIGARVTIERTAIVDTKSEPDNGASGMGVSVQASSPAELPGELTIRDSVIERYAQAGVAAFSSSALLERVVVRDPLFGPAVDPRGMGVVVDTHGASPGMATMRECVLERAAEVGLMVFNADVVVERSTIRDTQPRLADGRYGRGMNVQNDLTVSAGAPPRLRVSASLVDRSWEGGIVAVGADLEVDSTIVRNTRMGVDNGSGYGPFAAGVLVVATDVPATGVMTSSSIESNEQAGLLAAGGGVISVESTMLECNPIPMGIVRIEDDTGAIDDVGGNTCGCAPSTAPCVVEEIPAAQP